MFQTFSGNTALHIVSSLQNHKIQVEAVKLLMRKGADPGARNFENELPTQLVPEGPTGEKVECEEMIVIHFIGMNNVTKSSRMILLLSIK